MNLTDLIQYLPFGMTVNGKSKVDWKRMAELLIVGAITGSVSFGWRFYNRANTDHTTERVLATQFTDLKAQIRRGNRRESGQLDALWTAVRRLQREVRRH